MVHGGRDDGRAHRRGTRTGRDAVIEPNDEMLSRYLDDELGASDRAAVRALLERDADARARLGRMTRVRALMRSAAEEHVAEADDALDGLWARVERGIAADAAPLGWAERARAWWSEFVEHRRAIWVPASAAVAVATVVAVIGLRGGDVTETPALRGSQVVAVSFGEGGGTVYEVPADGDATTVVIWMNDE